MSNSPRTRRASSPKRGPAPKAGTYKPKRNIADFGPPPANCVVTGGAGFVGQRLVEMLVERGAKRVVSLDIAPTRDPWVDPRIIYVEASITDRQAVFDAIEVNFPLKWRVLIVFGILPRLLDPSIPKTST